MTGPDYEAAADELARHAPDGEPIQGWMSWAKAVVDAALGDNVLYHINKTHMVDGDLHAMSRGTYRGRLVQFYPQGADNDG